MELTINNRKIGRGHPVYIIAEMSANHNQSLEQALKIVRAAKASGADALKTQTYTADTMTIDCDSELFRIKGTVWDGMNLYRLYQQAATPWDWQPTLKKACEQEGLDFFSTPFDQTAVDYLESLGVCAYKIASFEVVDIPLLKKIAATGKPVIMSTGMAARKEIDEAVDTLGARHTGRLALLKCSSDYPALPENMNLSTIAELARLYDVPAGLSDHSLDNAVAVAAVAAGACIIEKHFTLSRREPGPDSAFSMEPKEFSAMVASVRTAQKAMGEVRIGPDEGERKNLVFRRSLFVVAAVKKGEVFTGRNVRSIRPAYGLHPRYLELVLGKRAAVDLAPGTPLRLEHVQGVTIDNIEGGPLL